MISLRCLLGFHARRSPCGFVRYCLRCRTFWEADYYQWRAEGFPRWSRVKLEELGDARREKAAEMLKDIGAL